MQTATEVIKESDLIPAPQGPNRFTVKSYLHGAPPDARMQIRNDGTIWWNTAEKSTGEWEVGYRVGSKMVWTSAAYTTGAFALPLAEGI